VVVAVVIIIAFVLVIVVVIVLQKKKTAAAKDADLITGASAPPGTDPPAQMAEMVVIIPSAAAAPAEEEAAAAAPAEEEAAAAAPAEEEAAAAAPAEEEAAAEQIANECAAKYPLIKVDLAHGHLITLKSLKFLPNSADPEEPELFEALLQQLGACMILANDPPYERDIHLVIGGHTDCPKEKATTSYFINLSNKRAESVKAHLVKMHPKLDASHLYPKGYGGARPIPGAIVGEGDRPNMRITFEATVASAVDAIIAAEVVYEGLAPAEKEAAAAPAEEEAAAAAPAEKEAAAAPAEEEAAE